MQKPSPSSPRLDRARFKDVPDKPLLASISPKVKPQSRPLVIWYSLGFPHFPYAMTLTDAWLTEQYCTCCLLQCFGTNKVGVLQRSVLSVRICEISVVRKTECTAPLAPKPFPVVSGLGSRRVHWLHTDRWLVVCWKSIVAELACICGDTMQFLCGGLR